MDVACQAQRNCYLYLFSYFWAIFFLPKLRPSSLSPSHSLSSPPALFPSSCSRWLSSHSSLPPPSPWRPCPLISLVKVTTTGRSLLGFLSQIPPLSQKWLAVAFLSLLRSVSESAVAAAANPAAAAFLRSLSLPRRSKVTSTILRLPVPLPRILSPRPRPLTSPTTTLRLPRPLLPRLPQPQPLRTPLPLLLLPRPRLATTTAVEGMARPTPVKVCSLLFIVP